MRMFKSLAGQMLAILIFAILILLFWDTENAGQEHETYKNYNEGWSLETNGIITEYEKLPEMVDTAGTGKVILRKKLDNSLEKISSLGFYTSHQLIDVYVGHRRVYRVYPQKLMTSKTPGNLWNFVSLGRPDSGKEVAVILTNCYEKEKIAIPFFYLGAKDSIMLGYIGKQIPIVMVSIVTLFLGVMLVVIYFGIRKILVIGEGTLWLGMLAIPFAVWSVLECQIVTFFTNQTLLMSQITFAVLKLLPIPILQFVNTMYEMKEDIVLKRFCQMSMIDFWGTSILQLLGVADYKESLWITHAIFVASACYVLGLGFKMRRGKSVVLGKSRYVMMIHAVCVEIVSVCVLLDVFLYYAGNRMDAAAFSRIGLLIYIIVLAVLMMRDSVQLIRAGKQANIIRRESEIDDMTKLKNRRAFERTVNTMRGKELEEYGILIFDLNNLKRFNDVYGHSMGDYYIIVSSEMMQDLFGEYGTIYRIGGDEFCGIVKGIDSSRVQVLHKEMCQKLQAIGNNEWIKAPMEVAIGFASFDRKLDGNLSDTMERADACMYQKKKEMKELSLMKKKGL